MSSGHDGTRLGSVIHCRWEAPMSIRFQKNSQRELSSCSSRALPDPFASHEHGQPWHRERKPLAASLPIHLPSHVEDRSLLDSSRRLLVGRHVSVEGFTQHGASGRVPRRLLQDHHLWHRPARWDHCPCKSVPNERICVKQNTRKRRKKESSPMSLEALFPCHWKLSFHVTEKTLPVLLSSSVARIRRRCLTLSAT
jgi:hypothetical protein